MLKYNWKVQINESGLSLAHFLKEKLGISSKKIKNLIDLGSVTINKRIEKYSNFIVASGDNIELLEKDVLSIEKLKPIYEDETVVVFNKPPFISTEELALVFNKLILVHRLDKETSGAIIFAKTEAESIYIKNSFKERLIEKTYIAVADGLLKTQVTKTDYLGIKSEKLGQKIMESKRNPKEGLLSITDFEPIDYSSNCTLVICKPKTGRTHQIRVHLSELGHPILGDWTYGQKFRCSHIPSRVMLHALNLKFMNSKNKLISLQAPIYQDIKDFLPRVGLIRHKIF
jgi:23S rRNA-/tRNA-specific pseudouridylate synthase